MEPAANEQKLTIRQRRIMAFFVEATEKILKEDGLSGVNIRRIASEAGYNSATLYNYFPRSGKSHPLWVRGLSL